MSTQPRRRSPLLYIAIAAAGALMVGGVGVVVAAAANRGPSGAVTADDCIDVSFGMERDNTFGVGQPSDIPGSLRVKCDDGTAEGKVVKVVDERSVNSSAHQSRPQPECPDGTDGVANVQTDRESEIVYMACVRNLKGPHPGDPGAGGGSLGVGDCVSGARGTAGREVPCSGDDWYGKLIGRVDTEQSCPAETQEVLKLKPRGGRGHVPRPVLCLGSGGQVLSPGECIADPSVAITPSRADCSTSQAVAEITGRAKTRQECPAGTTHYREDRMQSYLPVLCLKQMRPTRIPLRALGG